MFGKQDARAIEGATIHPKTVIQLAKLDAKLWKENTIDNTHTKVPKTWMVLRIGVIKVNVNAVVCDESGSIGMIARDESGFPLFGKATKTSKTDPIQLETLAMMGGIFMAQQWLNQVEIGSDSKILV